MPKQPSGRPTGRPSLPVERQRALGNPHQHALPPVPTPGQGLPAAAKPPTTPRGLDKAGRALWRRVWRGGAKWLSPESDYEVAEQLARAADERDQLREWLAEGSVERRWYTTTSGQVVTHPAVTQLRALDTQMTAWLAAIGFTPSDRTRLGLAEVRTVNELDAYRARADARARGGVGADVVDAKAH